MRSLMWNLAHSLQRMNESAVAEVVHGGDPNTTVRPPEQGDKITQVRARRICLSWDMRDDKGETDPVLNGKLHLAP